MIEVFESCSSKISVQILLALCSVESNLNPYALGIVDNYLTRQPKTAQEAQLVIEDLNAGNHNYSVGLCQINIKNILKENADPLDYLDPCVNIQHADNIFYACYERSKRNYSTLSEIDHVMNAASCYYSGNFKRGYSADRWTGNSYVYRFLNKYEQLWK